MVREEETTKDDYKKPLLVFQRKLTIIRGNFCLLVFLGFI